MLDFKIRFTSLGFILALVLLVATGVAQANTQAGVDYLVGSQRVDGRVVGESSIASEFQATAESLRALDFVVDTHGLNTGTANDYLDSATDRSTESLARSIILAIRSGTDTQPAITDLLLHGNQDGGFGDYPASTSSVLDTAFALEAFGESGYQSTAVSGAVAYLLNRQGPDGAWKDGSNASSVYLSALTMRALWHQRSMFVGIGDSLERAQQFLFNQRIPETGLWAETHESALALLAIIPNVSELAAVEALINDLDQLQLPDGSWEGDAYTTSLVLRAINSQPTPPPLVVTTGSISGQVLNSTTGVAIGGALVSIDAISVSVTAGADGSFAIADLAPGDYSLDVAVGGYARTGFDNVAVSAGVNNNLGKISLAPLSTTSVLQGQVTDQRSGEPVAGAQIRISGANSVSMTSLANGSFSIVGLAPGSISIAVVQSGYAPISAGATITAGTTVVFNPALIPLDVDSEADEGVEATGSLRGIVTDALAATPLQQAIVRVFDAGSNRSLAYKTTGSDGAYQIADLDPGEIRIQISRAGYLAVEAFTRVYAGNAIVFSPGLVTEGGDPDDATGTEADLEPLPETGTTGSIIGVAIDQGSALPLAGVEISVSGSAAAVATTGADGRYSIAALPPGDVEITATLDDYLTVVATGVVVAGNNLVFNPEMIPEGFAGDAVGSIVGRVVEASSGDPVRYAVVTATGSAGDATGSSRFDGAFELLDLEPGNYRIRFERQGFVPRSFEIVVTSAAAIDLGIIELDQALTQTAVYGMVSDSATGAPIENAVISILGTTLSTQTDDEGTYRLDDIGTGSKSLLIGATGYNTETYLFNFPDNGEYRLDYDLTLSESTGLNLTFFGTDQPNYAAYSPVDIQASVLNNGSPVQAMAVFLLFDENNALVSEFAGTEPGATETDILFETGAITALEAGFDTRNLAPGQYRLVARILAGNQLAGPATVILDERVAHFSVEETRRIAQLSVEGFPDASAVGVSEQMTIVATVQNRSNVDTSIRIRYQFVDPLGAVRISSTFINVPLSSEDDTVVVDLDTFEFDFELAGDYQLRILDVFPQVVDEFEQDLVSVAPGLRIEPSQSLDPDLVTPDENKRIRVNIRLQGMEVE